ncbi:MAG: LysM domain-containing protein [Clostridia bacterium]|nr:LysM domain-containing protein [Clostridia bacterium]
MTLSGYIYHCAANESFDSVALNVYGHEKYAADIMDANPEYSGWTVFDGGEELRLPALNIPSVTRESALVNTIAPWKT